MPASKQYFYTNHFYKSIARLDQIILLTFLNPFLKNQDFFNKNKSQIRDKLQAFLMQEHSEELKQKISAYYNTQTAPSHYTLEQVLNELKNRKNPAVLQWAEVNLKHYYYLDLIAKLGTIEYQTYAYLLGLKNAPLTKPVSELQAALCAPLLPEQKTTTKIGNTKKIATLMPTLIQHFSFHATRYHGDLDTVTGYPINQSFPEQYGMIINTIVGTIFLAAIAITLATFIPVIPVTEFRHLNNMYVNIFSALNWVGNNHHFSFRAIHLMSFGFVALIDTLLFCSTVAIEQQYKTYQRETLVPAFQQKMIKYCTKELAVLNAGMQLAPVSETEFSCYNVKNRTVEQQKFYNSILTYKGAAASPINRVSVLC